MKIFASQLPSSLCYISFKKKEKMEFPLLSNATAKMNFLIALTVLATISSSLLPGP
jgi:hypothetical protein